MRMSKLISVLDIGTSKISVFVGAIGVNDMFVVRAKSSISYSGYVNSEWVEKSELTRAISLAIFDAEKQLGDKIRNLYIGVPSAFVKIAVDQVNASYSSPRIITNKELSSMYNLSSKYEASGEMFVIDYGPIHFTLDEEERLSDPCGKVAKNIEGVISVIMMRRDIYNTLYSILELLGVKHFEFIASNWAAGMFLLPESIRDECAILLDIGYLDTTFSLLKGDGILYQSSLSMGLASVDERLFTLLKIPFEYAVKARESVNLNLLADDIQAYNISVDDIKKLVSAKRVNSIVTSVIDNIGEEVKYIMNNCTYDFPDYIPVHLTGGGLTSITGAKSQLEKVIGRNVDIVIPSVPKYANPAYSTVFGVMYAASRIRNRMSLKNIIKRLLH